MWRISAFLPPLAPPARLGCARQREWRGRREALGWEVRYGESAMRPRETGTGEVGDGWGGTCYAEREGKERDTGGWRETIEASGR